MKNHDYEYNYHELANDADFFDDDSWIFDDDEEDDTDGVWDNSYNHLNEDISDD